VGHLVLNCISENKALEDLSVEEFNKSVDELGLDSYKGIFSDDIFNAISLETCVNSRTVDGGPSKEYIEKLILFNKEYIKELK
jgi:argininosuccinate lyase